MKDAEGTRRANVVAIMQPYLFPYVGYLNLVHAADQFVFLDDVNFIRRGWIHRNRILIAGSEFTFTVPIRDASQNRRIVDTQAFDVDAFAARFSRQLAQSYGRAPYFERTMEYVSRTLASDNDNVGRLAANSITNFFQLIGIDKTFHFASASFGDTVGLDKSDRLIEITRRLDADHYVNVRGGEKLYSKQEFAKSSIELSFVKPTIRRYPQFNVKGFVGELSVLDLLMNLSIEDIQTQLESYTLL